MFTALTIAGTDPSGGAGIHADLKTFTAHKVYGMSVITSVVAQNTCGVTKICDMQPDMINAQMDAVFTDIFPDAVKIGMVSNIDIIASIVEKLKQYKPKNIVLDTVMVSTSRHRLLQENAEQALINTLIPLADIITPNIPEAEVLAKMSISNKEEMVKATKKIAENFNGYILLKGGHLADTSDDLLYYKGTENWLAGRHIETKNTHGTGCTLSSAIASNLAQGQDMLTAVKNAKDYVTGALASGLDLGKGNGPIDHCFNLK